MAKKIGEAPEELDRMPQKSGAGKRGENLKNKKKYKNKKADPDETDGDFFVEEDLTAVQDQLAKQEKDNTSDVANLDVETKNGLVTSDATQIEDEKLGEENVKIEHENMDEAEKSNGSAKKQLSSVVIKAIKDKDFAHDLMKHEMDKLEGRGKGKKIKDKEFAQISAAYEINNKLKKENADFAKAIAADIEKFKNNLGVLINKLDGKLKNFQKLYPNDIEFQNKISKIISNYKNKVKKFDVIEENDRETLVKINQLHHELQEWVGRDWLKLYERKKETETVLHNLNDVDLHGKDSPVIENINELEKMDKKAALEKKYGKIGASYIRHDKSGFPSDSFTIVGYEIGEDAESNFVVIDRLKRDGEVAGSDLEKENIETKIGLKEFKKYKVGYRKEVENVGDKNKETKGNIVELLKEEREELEKLVQEKVSETDNLLSDSEGIFNGIKKELSEDDLKGIEKRIISCKIGLNNIKNLIAKDSEIYKDTRVLGIMNNLEEKVKRLSSDVSEIEKIQHEKNIAFNEVQKEKIKILTELFRKKDYIESLETVDWDGYREDDKIKAIELITKSQIRLILSTMKDVFDSTETIEKAVDEIFTILNKNKSHFSEEK